MWGQTPEKGSDPVRTAGNRRDPLEVYVAFRGRSPKVESLLRKRGFVVAYLKKAQIKDEVNFVGVEMNSEVLRGSILHFIIPAAGYGEPTFCADIYYDKSQTSDWKRLVCCKELLHLLDPDTNKVKSKADFVRQVERIVLPPEFQEPVADGAKVLSDRVATYLAVAILFPWQARQLLLPPYVDGKLTLEDISRIADIPERYVALVLSDEWDTFHEIMIETA